MILCCFIYVDPASMLVLYSVDDTLDTLLIICLCLCGDIIINFMCVLNNVFDVVLYASLGEGDSVALLTRVPCYAATLLRGVIVSICRYV